MARILLCGGSGGKGDGVGGAFATRRGATERHDAEAHTLMRPNFHKNGLDDWRLVNITPLSSPPEVSENSVADCQPGHPD